MQLAEKLDWKGLNKNWTLAWDERPRKKLVAASCLQKWLYFTSHFLWVFQ
jgi:hypothetical protein